MRERERERERERDPQLELNRGGLSKNIKTKILQKNKRSEFDYNLITTVTEDQIACD